jgi:aspartokinase/homoserine dehydrogenase 1
MQVLKFGGSSVANSQNINNVVAIVQRNLLQNKNIIVVLSALGGTTDALLDAASTASSGDISYKEKLHCRCLRSHCSVSSPYLIHCFADPGG